MLGLEQDPLLAHSRIFGYFQYYDCKELLFRASSNCASSSCMLNQVFVVGIDVYVVPCTVKYIISVLWNGIIRLIAVQRC
jgi:hypothetical protein